MKINKVVIYILFAIILNNCSTYSKEGVYYTKNIKNYITTQYNYFELKFNEKVIKGLCGRPPWCPAARMRW